MIDPASAPAPPAGTVLAAAVAGDAPEILVLQRCCWVTEAIVNDTLDIPPLHEDLDTVRAWVVDQEVWTLRLAGRLVGGVRAHRAGDRWEIGRLMVAPDLRGRGVGRWLLEHAERRAPVGVAQFTLFTGERSERNLRMYRRAGYVLTEPPPDFTGHHIRGAVALARPAPTPR